MRPCPHLKKIWNEEKWREGVTLTRQKERAIKMRAEPPEPHEDVHPGGSWNVLRKVTTPQAIALRAKIKLNAQAQ